MWSVFFRGSCRNSICLRYPPRTLPAQNLNAKRLTHHLNWGLTRDYTPLVFRMGSKISTIIPHGMYRRRSAVLDNPYDQPRWSYCRSPLVSPERDCPIVSKRKEPPPRQGRSAPLNSVGRERDVKSIQVADVVIIVCAERELTASLCAT